MFTTSNKTNIIILYLSYYFLILLFKNGRSTYGKISFVQCPFMNRPFPSCKKSHLQNEARCETFVVKMSFICIIIKNHFHINSFALSLALKVRFFWTRKWPIALRYLFFSNGFEINLLYSQLFLNKHLFRRTTLWCWPLSLSSHLTVTML